MEKNLTAKDICSIVKACASSGVREITLGDVIIKFGGPIEDTPSNIHYTVTHPYLDNEVTTDEGSEESNNDDLDQLLMENPAEYERRRLEENNG